MTNTLSAKVYFCPSSKSDQTFRETFFSRQTNKSIINFAHTNQWTGFPKDLFMYIESISSQSKWYFCYRMRLMGNVIKNIVCGHINSRFLEISWHFKCWFLTMINLKLCFPMQNQRVIRNLNKQAYFQTYTSRYLGRHGFVNFFFIPVTAFGRHLVDWHHSYQYIGWNTKEGLDWYITATGRWETFLRKYQD